MSTCFPCWTRMQHLIITSLAVSQSQVSACSTCHVSSTFLLWFGEGAQLFGVDISQLLQLPLSSPVQILNVHHVRLLDASVDSELVTNSGDEAWFVLTSPEELPVQGQDLLLQLTVPRHPTRCLSTTKILLSNQKPGKQDDTGVLRCDHQMFSALSSHTTCTV